MRSKLKKRTETSTPTKSVSASVLDAVLASETESSSGYICGFAHSLMANILITPAPTASQTLIHIVCLQKQQ
jgi:hypothetical protein